MNERRIPAPAATYVARLDGPVLRATGIRYARAERYGLPVAVPDSLEEVAALEFSPRCPQRSNPLATPGGDGRNLPTDEHCQYLSVTAPWDAAPGDDLPVMVWIHGGSYETGGGDEAYSDPLALVSEQRVIVVTVTYRLGPLGFLGGGERPANLGLLDQIEALRWVQRNIGAFGGNPANVTAFGQSAGGDAVVNLLVAEDAEALLRRVIAQSPPLGIARGRARMAAAMARRAVDLPDVLDDAAMVDAQRRIVTGLPLRHGWLASMPFGPQYGHHPLPEEGALDGALAQAAGRVDVLIGSTSREAALFAELMPAISRLRLHPATRPLYEAAVRMATRRVYDGGLDHFVDVYRSAGGNVTRYLLDWGAGPRFQGAHVIDLALLFPTHPWSVGEMLEGVPLDVVATQGAPLRAMWAEFARTGHVGVAALPGILRVVD